jgi:AraC-like DNA-binding protein
MSAVPGFHSPSSETLLPSRAVARPIFGIANEQGPFGNRIAKSFNLDGASWLTTKTLNAGQLAVTRLTAGKGGVGRTSPIPVEKAYIVSLQLKDLFGNELWKEGRLAAKGPFPEGSIGIVHLEEEPVAYLPEAFDCLQYYIPEIVFDELADEQGAPRISEFAFQPATPDPIAHQLGRALLPLLEEPCRASHLFFDHIVLATYSHLAMRYGRLREQPVSRGSRLSAWQERVAKEKLTADLAEEPSIADVARACGLTESRFIRAFRASTGAPPHRWLRGFRVERAKELLIGSASSLAQIAYDCGFADQSHFTRVFYDATGITPGAWRRARRG